MCESASYVGNCFGSCGSQFGKLCVVSVIEVMLVFTKIFLSVK